MSAMFSFVNETAPHKESSVGSVACASSSARGVEIKGARSTQNYSSGAYYLVALKWYVLQSSEHILNLCDNMRMHYMHPCWRHSAL